MIFNKQALLALGIACAACPFSHASKGGKNHPNSSKAHKHKESTPFFLASAACAQKCMSAEFQPDSHLLMNAIQQCDAKSSNQQWDIVPVPDSTFVKVKSVGVGPSGDSTNGWCLGPVPQEAVALYPRDNDANGYPMFKPDLVLTKVYNLDFMQPGFAMLCAGSVRGDDGWIDYDMCSGKLGLVSCDHQASQWYSTDGQLISSYCLGIGLSSFLSVNEGCTDLHLSTTSDGATAISRAETFMAVTQEFIETIPPPHVPTYYPTSNPTGDENTFDDDWHF